MSDNNQQTRGDVVARIAQAMRDDNPPEAWQRTAPLAPMGHFAEVALRELAGGDPPPSLDARPVVLWSVHCSHCGTPYLDPDWDRPWVFRTEELAKLRDYCLEDYEWRVNRYPGHPLVCEDCSKDVVCDDCYEWIAKWEPRIGSEADGWFHPVDGCPSTAAPLPGEEPLIGGES